MGMAFVLFAAQKFILAVSILLHSQKEFWARPSWAQICEQRGERERE
jgi:hypothetical protein